jgi:GTPase involved in cell partitioning and DNA repair
MDCHHRIHKGSEYRSRIRQTEKVPIGTFHDKQGGRGAAVRFPADTNTNTLLQLKA